MDGWKDGSQGVVLYRLLFVEYEDPEVTSGKGYDR